MKKFAVSMLAAVLLLTLVCASALATSGDVTVKAAKAYADPNMTHYIGTIPAYTSVLVRAYGTYADVYVNGVQCYVSPSALTCGAKDFDYIGTAVLKPGATVYQRPTTASKYVVTAKAHPVLVYAVNNGCALIRTGLTGVFGFVSAEELVSLAAN